VLYSPVPGAVAWRGDDHDQMMVVTMMFAWHMAALLVATMCIGAAVAACFSRCAAAPGRAPAAGDDDQLPLLVRRHSNGHARRPTASSSNNRHDGTSPAVGYCEVDELDSDGDSVQVDFRRPHTATTSADDVTH